MVVIGRAGEAVLANATYARTVLNVAAMAVPGSAGEAALASTTLASTSSLSAIVGMARTSSFSPIVASPVDGVSRLNLANDVARSTLADCAARLAAPVRSSMARDSAREFVDRDRKEIVKAYRGIFVSLDAKYMETN